MSDLITQPSSSQPAKENTPDQVRVFSMPAKYRHGAVVNMVEPQKGTVTPVVPVQPPVPPKPVAPLPPAIKKLAQPPSHTKKGLIIAGVIVVIASLIGGYLLMRSSQKNKEAALAAQQAAKLAAEQQATQTNSQTPTETTQTPAGTPDTTGGIPANPFPAAATPGVDTDSDGLTDTEETIVYGTNPALPDTDGDGFLDGNEVFHGYNPNGTAPGTLVLAGLAQSLAANGFSILYPAKWSVLAGEADGYVISSTTSESIKISAVTKAATLSLSDWYQQIVKDGVLNLAKTKKGSPLLVASNQLTAYVDLGTSVVTLVYDTSAKPTIDYLNTFQMMINSLEVGK